MFILYWCLHAATKTCKTMSIILFSNLEILICRPCMGKFFNVLFFFFLLYSYLGLYLDKSCPYFSVLYPDHYWLDSTRLEIHYSKILFLFVSSNVFDQNLDQGLNLLFLPKYSLFCSAKTVDYVLKRFIEICSFKNKLSSLIKNKQTNSSKEKIH